MKVGFYVNNSQFPNVDCRSVRDGNPGVGGTWHMVLLVSSQLALRNNNIDITLFSQVDGLLPEGPITKQARNQEQAIYEADKNGLDYIVLNYGGFDWASFDFTKIKSKLRIIVWCHNFCNLKDLDLFSSESKIARIITVGREQMDLYRDHPAFNKTDYIYNCVPFPNAFKDDVVQHSFNKRENNVVYLASLVPAKSFHILADVWPYVLKHVPDANLFVIGSGKTYFKDAVLGDYGIASPEYEKRFIKPLLNTNKAIMPSVHFLGNLGLEKYNYLLKSKVGVPNPTGATETFCISAVEMQYMGCCVSAMIAPGYYDTFVNGVITKRTKRAFANSIIKLLKSQESVVSYSETIERLQKMFSVDNVLKDWELLFDGDLTEHIHHITPLKNRCYRLKWLKEYKRTIRWTTPIVENILLLIDDIKKKIIGY